MASSGNFCTWNPLAQGNKSDIAFSSGNCAVTCGSGQFKSLSNFLIPTNSGKWYVEVCMTSNSGNTSYVGIVSEKSPDLNATGDGFNFGRSSGDKTVFFDITIGKIKTENSDSQTGLSSFSSANDIIGMVLDMDNDTVQFYGNGSAIGSAQAFPDVGDNYYIWCGGNNDKVCHINTGQDSTFGGAITAGGNADGNGFGDFKYSVPTDAKAITTANLPISDDIDPAQTDDDFPQKNFNVLTYTGNGSTQSISNLGFQPDLVWIKQRDGTNHGSLYDSNRGVTKRLKSSSTEQETTVVAGFTGFDSDGFSLGSATENNGSSSTYVAWCWRANGGTTSSNSDGSITTTLQAGKGFSIGTYTGTGSNATVGHGLGAVPDFTIFRERSSSGNWVVTSQKNMSSNDHNLYLQLSNAESDGNYFQNTAMTSSVISIGTHADINGSSNTYVMYNWINVEGYQRFDKYTGNGSTDGPFIYTGFRPRMLFIKRTDSAANWQVRDTARRTFNVHDVTLNWDDSTTETQNSNHNMDILSNGFKLRTTLGDYNTSGGTYIYGAWGDVPFKYNNTF